MPQAIGRIVLGQFRQIETGREMIADAMDDNGADAFGDVRETILDRENDAVVQRIELGRAVEPTDSTGPVVSILSSADRSAVATDAAFPMAFIMSCTE